MHRTLGVIQNKNKREKEAKQRKTRDLNEMRLESAYKARLYEEMEKIDILFRDSDVAGIDIDIPDKFISQFQKAIFSEEMAKYSIGQIDTGKFYVERRILNF